MASTNVMFLRTVNTGSNPPEFKAEIQSIYLSDAQGNPVSVATKGTLSYFTVTLKNNQPAPLDTLVAISIFDNNNCPIGFSSAQTAIPQGTSVVILSIPITTWAISGRATVFATLCSKLPSTGGVPYCTEASGFFTINGQQGADPPTTPNGNQGQYALSFRIPPKASTTIPYTIYMSSAYTGLQAFSNAAFSVYQPGDFNGDSKLNYLDIAQFMDAYINYYQHNPFDSRADFDSNGKVDYRDISAFMDAYIIYYSHV
jgi:hypothetical protein